MYAHVLSALSVVLILVAWISQSWDAGRCTGQRPVAMPHLRIQSSDLDYAKK